MNPISILEKFVSLQGEGSSQGFPTTFIRVAGCNLKCSYCDTKHSWNTNNCPKESIDDIYNWIKDQWPGIVCLTGGEPLIYPDIDILINRLAIEGYDVVIETNGTCHLGNIKKKILPEALPRISFVMDFKSLSVDMSISQRLMTEENLKEIRVYDEVKFVVSFSEIHWAIETIKSHDIRNPVISPIISDCTTQTDLEQFADLVLHLAEYYNLPKLRLQTQLHKQIWGNRRKK